MNWTNVNDGMPPEKDSIFAKYYGTDKWTPAMFKKASKDVLVTIEFDDGKRITTVSHTNDGKWSYNSIFSSLKAKVLYWAPMPEPCQDDIKNITENLYIKDTSECPIDTYVRNHKNCKDCGFCERWE